MKTPMKTPLRTIEVWDREAGALRTEVVYNGPFLTWCYETLLGRLSLDLLFARHPFHRLYGVLKSSRFSASKIARDIASFKLATGEYEPGPFRSYEEFFIRRFLPGKRPFVQDGRALAAFAEGRYVAYPEVTPEILFPVKGSSLDLGKLLCDAALAKRFEGGPMLICRLCPIDYHWFHFPDDGTTASRYTVGGIFHSVSPIGLRREPDVFLKNERTVSILETAHLGKLAYVEVGALSVGKILQSTEVGARFNRGDVKGRFGLGASTVIVVGERGAWTPDADIVAQTRAGRETFVKLGAQVGMAR